MEAALETMRLDDDFEELFKIQQYDIALQLTDKYQQLLKREQEPQNQSLKKESALALKRRRPGLDPGADSVNLRAELMEQRQTLDSLFLSVIISERTNVQVR
jgi:hypothetical protein